VTETPKKARRAEKIIEKMNVKIATGDQMVILLDLG
jgi:hypothetical protein